MYAADGTHDVHAPHYFTEESVLTVQAARTSCPLPKSNKPLRAVGVPFDSGAAQETRATRVGGGQAEWVIRERSTTPVNATSGTGAVADSHVAALHEKTRHDAVHAVAFVAHRGTRRAVLTGAELPKILCCAGAI